jgi:hypothetical protein
MKYSRSLHFKRDKMVETLLGEARLCDRISSDCSDLQVVEKLKRMSQECWNAAAIRVLQAASAGGFVTFVLLLDSPLLVNATVETIATERAGPNSRQ